MEFKIEKNSFQRVLSRMEGIISAREIRSVLSNILIETDNSRITLMSSDLEIGMSTSLAAEIVTAGAITLPARKLSQIVNGLQGEEFLIRVKQDSRVEIYDTSQKSRTRITLMGSPSEDYPSIPLPPEDKYRKIPIGLFIQMLNYTSYAIAKEDARYVFNGLYIACENSRVTFVATDGRRLSLVHQDFPEPLPFSQSLIVPLKTIKELQKLNEVETEGSIAYDDAEKRLYFMIGDIKIFSKLIDGSFPDYNQVIPKKVEYELLLNKEAFENSIKQVAVMAAEPSRQVRLHFSANNLNIDASTPDVGEAQDILSIDYEGEEMDMAFNSRYIIEILQWLKTENFILGFSSPNSPVVIQKPDNKDFTAVIMPMKI